MGSLLHFLSAWAIVLTGLVDVVFGFLTRHFGRHLLPGTEGASHYEPLQR
jgi:thiosulfate reductase cytochrome b subunit